MATSPEKSRSTRKKGTMGAATGSGEENIGEIGSNGEGTSVNLTSGDQNGQLTGTKNTEGASVGEASDESLNVALLPPRLFSTDRYPQKGRINSYSKPEYLLDIVEVLDGTPEFEWLKESCFGGLFQLPIRKSSLSGKLVHQILCRSLVTRKGNEIWFVFGGHPIRFSLREFGIVTGLNCGQFPPKDVIAKMQAFEEDEEGEVVKYYYNTLIGPKNSYTIQEIVNMLKLDKRLPVKDRMKGERRIRLALIVIVEGILVCNSSTVKASKKVAEMLKDVDEFVSYPWGRKAFKRTLEMVKVGKEVVDEAALVEKLSQSHTATHGFTLAFQLLALHAIPQLEAYLPDLNDEQTFTDRSVLQLTMLKTFHNSNILETELDPKLEVENIIHSEEEMDGEDFSWGNEEEDERVDYMYNKLKEGHIFKKDDWQGGVAHLPLITLSKAEKPKKGPARKPSKKKKGGVKATSQRKQKEHSVDADQRGAMIDGKTAEELLIEVDRRNNEHTLKVEQMLSIYVDEVVDKVLRILKEKGVYHTSESKDNNSSESKDNNTEEGVYEINKCEWENDGTGVDEIIRNVAKEAVSASFEAGGMFSASINAGGGMYTAEDREKASPAESAEIVKMHNTEDEDAGAKFGIDREQQIEDTLGSERASTGKTITESESDEQKEVEIPDVVGTGSGTEPVCIDQSMHHGKHENKEEESKVEAEMQESKENEIVGVVGQKDGKNPKALVGVTTKKRRNEIIEQELSTLPAKRTRTMPKRFGYTYSCKKKKADELNSDLDVYMPFRVVHPLLKKKLLSKLASYKEKEYSIDGQSVKSSFFEDLYTPKHWVQSPHMEAMLSQVWRTFGESFRQSRVAVLDTWFTHRLSTEYVRYIKRKKNSTFQWNDLIKNYVRGIVPTRSSNLAWFKDIDIVYIPMNWGARHWVGLCIQLKTGKIIILDPLIVNNDEKKLQRLMKPVVESLPLIIAELVMPESCSECPLPTSFTYERDVTVYQNERTGDCGPLTVKFIELHAQGLCLDGITDDMVDEMRMAFAVDIYQHCFGSLTT